MSYEEPRVAHELWGVGVGQDQGDGLHGPLGVRKGCREPEGGLGTRPAHSRSLPRVRRGDRRRGLGVSSAVGRVGVARVGRGGRPGMVGIPWVQATASSRPRGRALPSQILEACACKAPSRSVLAVFPGLLYCTRSGGLRCASLGRAPGRCQRNMSREASRTSAWAESGVVSYSRPRTTTTGMPEVLRVTSSAAPVSSSATAAMETRRRFP